MEKNKKKEGKKGRNLLKAMQQLIWYSQQYNSDLLGFKAHTIIF